MVTLISSEKDLNSGLPSSPSSSPNLVHPTNFYLESSSQSSSFRWRLIQWVWHSHWQIHCLRAHFSAGGGCLLWVWWPNGWRWKWGSGEKNGTISSEALTRLQGCFWGACWSQRLPQVSLNLLWPRRILNPGLDGADVQSTLGERIRKMGCAIFQVIRKKA